MMMHGNAPDSTEAQGPGSDEPGPDEPAGGLRAALAAAERERTRLPSSGQSVP